MPMDNLLLVWHITPEFWYMPRWVVAIPNQECTHHLLLLELDRLFAFG